MDPMVFGGRVISAVKRKNKNAILENETRGFLSFCARLKGNVPRCWKQQRNILKVAYARSWCDKQQQLRKQVMLRNHSETKFESKKK